MKAKRLKKGLESGTSWQWFLLAGILILFLLVMVFTTVQRVRQGRELMSAQIIHQGEMLLNSLEQATRASLRRGFFREQLLQTLAEEMVEDERVLSVTILDPQGGILALGIISRGQQKNNDPLEGLPDRTRQAVAQRKDVQNFFHDEFVLGRIFDPVRPVRDLPPGGSRNLRNKWSSNDRPGMGMMARRRNNMMHRDVPPWLNPPHMEGQRNLLPYALIRLSTKALSQNRIQALRSAVIMGGLIFAAAAVAAWGMWAAARRRSREVDQLKKEVAEAGHLAAVGRLAASVAHEVRNPLSAVRGLVQYLAKNFEPGSNQAEYAQAAVEEVDRLERVVSGLLDYSRPREVRFVETDLAESLHSVAALLRDDPRAQGVEIEVIAPGETQSVQADPDQVRQVLVNLIINGLEALDGRGRLELSLSFENGTARIKVSDDGPGLGDVDPESLFDPFYSTKERGTGLGLAIARRIARSHGGDLAAASPSGGGACFTLTLPRIGRSS